jgi:EAL and modified HD-GYP domain-containing signal transduction protein
MPPAPGTGALDAYLARQPVFNRSLSVVGYELLFRSNAENFFSAQDGDTASLQVIEASLNTFGYGGLASGGRAFINITRRMLVEGFTSLLPPKSTVLEILASVPPDPEVLGLSASLKKAGYLIALDDFTSAQSSSPLLPLADILKVDYQLASADEKRKCARLRLPPGAKLLAKKVGAQSEFKESADLGYSLFQGLFFRKPEMLSRKEVPGYKVTYLRLLNEINAEECDYAELEEIIRRDLALSFKLLRYVNSALVSPERPVESIKQALSMVGLGLMKRWVSMVTLVAMGQDKPGELMVGSLIRARFCEYLALKAGLKEQSGELFMIGLLSMLDVIVGRPMLEVLADLPLSDQAKGAVLGKAGREGDILGLTVAYERAEWDRIPLFLDRLTIKEKLKIDIAGIPALYRESVAWADKTFKAAIGEPLA